MTIDVPSTFTVARDGTGFVAMAPSKAASVGITLLRDVVDPGEELQMAALFQKGAKTERDETGGTVTTATTTTRMLRAGGGFVRCYVKGASADARAKVCGSLRTSKMP